MKKLYTLFSVIVLILQTLPVSASVFTDTTKSIPFLENWESGSFFTNGWTFPYGQGNWTITSSSGDSSLNSEFPGQPSQSNYFYELKSPWFDATQNTCDYIYLDFDLRLKNLYTTGTEFMKVVFELDTEADTIKTIKNSSNDQSWKHYTIQLIYAPKKVFSIKFLVSGSNSVNIISWSVDNIAITKKCKPPHELTVQIGGQCGSSSCLATLTWLSPDCSSNSSFIYDDGTAENGEAINPGWVWWLGNKFPIAPDIEGFLTSFDIWFWTNPTHGSDLLTLDVFDMNMTLLGSSAPFLPPDSTWISLDVNNLWFHGPFYALVKWNATTHLTNYLGIDENGSLAPYQLAMEYNGSGFPTPIINCGGNLVWLLRANANVTNKKKMTPLDTTILLGYNIYRSDGYGNTDFLKINNAPLTETTFTDSIDCAANYYVTVQYNTCESDSSIHKSADCPLGVPETSKPVKIKIDPNPVSAKIDISSDFLINTIRITDLFGREQLNLNNIDKKEIRIVLSDLKNGMYLVVVQTEHGQAARKIIIEH